MSEPADRDALAEVLLSVDTTPAERAGMPFPAASYLIEASAGDFADAILASDWLAQRDRRVAVEAVVRNFADFLTAMAEAGIRPAKPGEPRTPEAAAKARAIYLQHYPDERTNP